MVFIIIIKNIWFWLLCSKSQEVKLQIVYLEKWFSGKSTSNINVYNRNHIFLNWIIYTLMYWINQMYTPTSFIKHMFINKWLSIIFHLPVFLICLLIFICNKTHLFLCSCFFFKLTFLCLKWFTEIVLTRWILHFLFHHNI